MQQSYVNTLEIVLEEESISTDTTIFAVKYDSDMLAIAANYNVSAVDTFDDIFSNG